MNFYQHHIGDFNNATRHLSRLERSIYRDMLEVYYDSENPLMLDFDKLARRCLVNECDMQAMQGILDEFFVKEIDGYHNLRADREIESYQRMSEGGKRGAAKRWSKGIDIPPIATLSPPVSTPNANHEPLTMNHEPLTINQETEEKTAHAKRSTPIVKPDDVDEQVWQDWRQLRKTKKAPVTQTVLSGAIRESEKAGMSLNEFLEVWCRRGSQGLEAAWLKVDEKKHRSAPMSFATQDVIRDMLRWEEMTGEEHPDWQVVGGRPIPKTSVDMGIVIDSIGPSLRRISS